MTKTIRKSPTGKWIKSIEGYTAFVPDPIPRTIDLDPSLVYLLDKASRSVATLAGIGETLPNPYLLIRPFIRREAVLSSRIEGTQSSLSDLLIYEATGGSKDPGGDAIEVANYVRALEHGLSLLDKLPLSVRLMNEIHEHLLAGVRGEDKAPGELRTRQVWIGEEGTTVEEARFVPPPENLIRDLLTDVEVFLNEDMEMPPVIQAAMMHYQFEAIHPYLDGNGRMGRLLIPLFFCSTGVLPTPLLYLSAFFDRNRNEYYDRLLSVSEEGKWHAWIRFFLQGVAEQAQDAVIRSRRVRQLQERYRSVLQQRRTSVNTLRLLETLFLNPFTTASLASSQLQVTDAGVRGILNRLVEAGILHENRTMWPRMYVARELLEAIERPVAQDTPDPSLPG